MDNGCSCCSTWSIIAVMLIAVCTRGALASVDTTPAPEPAPEADGPPEFLFQMVATGAIFEAGEGSFDGVLTLENVNNETITFSDRKGVVADAPPIATRTGEDHGDVESGGQAITLSVSGIGILCIGDRLHWRYTRFCTGLDRTQ